MRAFIAITLPQTVKEGLIRLQDRLKTAQADVKWIEAAQLHVTLKFLEDIDETSRKEICIALDKTAASTGVFEIGLSTVGAFPRPESPRIIWAGINVGTGPLQTLVQDLENQLIRIGIPKEERPFNAHITLGRTRTPHNLDQLTRKLASLKNLPPAEQLTFPARALTFFKSTLTPQGPVYEIIQESTLKTV